MFRLALAVLFFIFSLLVVFKSPTNTLWRASVALTEFPHLLILSSLLLLISTYWAEKYKITTLLLSSIAFIIFCSTIVRAYNRASKIDEELASSFSNKNYSSLTNPLSSPFQFIKLFLGIGTGKNEYKTISYKEYGTQQKLSFDYYPSATNQTASCVIVIHGGSWKEGDSQQLPELNSYLSSRGYNVASISYHLAPEYKNPAPVEDTKDAINYIVQHAQELKVDTNNFILLGRSAGGQIALLSAYTLHNKNIKGVISIYAPADMVWGAKHKGNKWVLDTDKVLGDYIGGSIDDVPEKYVQSSPFEFVDSASTPTLIIHGEHDCMVSYQHSVHLHKKLNDYKVKNYLLNLPWGTHGCDYNLSGPSGQISTYTIERFLNSVLTK